MLQPMLKTTPHQIRHHLMSMHELIQITSFFNDVKINYIVLKGIPLNQLLYGTQLVRTSRDIDILIQVKDIVSVHQYLVTQGYQLHSSVPIADLTGKSVWLTQFVDEILYWHPDKNIAFDVKWYPSTMNCLGMSWCDTKNYTDIDINGYKIRTLHSAQNFYYLCIHAAKHHWESMQWMQDIAEFSQKISFSWDTVVSLARDTQAIRALLETSILLRRHFDIQLGEIPHSFWDTILVKVRLSCTQSDWFKRVSRDQKFKCLLSEMLNILLYPKLAQKYHYIQRLLLLRVKSLRQIGRFKKPQPYKIILFSFWPFRVSKK